MDTLLLGILGSDLVDAETHIGCNYNFLVIISVALQRLLGGLVDALRFDDDGVVEADVAGEARGRHVVELVSMALGT